MLTHISLHPSEAEAQNDNDATRVKSSQVVVQAHKQLDNEYNSLDQVFILSTEAIQRQSQQ